MEGGLAEAQTAFAMLDAQMSRESQTAAKIGDRLHVRSPAPETLPAVPSVHATSMLHGVQPLMLLGDPAKTSNPCTAKEKSLSCAEC